MEIAKRACIYMGEMECNADCPCNMDGEEYKCSFSHARDVSDWQKVERRLIEWDKARPTHPPTWNEWRNTLSTNPERWDEFCPQMLLGERNFPCAEVEGDMCAACLDRPIPEETAVILGIWPPKDTKEG